jgi:hypothetical protein
MEHGMKGMKSKGHAGAAYSRFPLVGPARRGFLFAVFVSVSSPVLLLFFLLEAFFSMGRQSGPIIWLIIELLFLFCTPDYLILDQGGGRPSCRIVALSHCRIVHSLSHATRQSIHSILPISQNSNVLYCNTVKSVHTTYAIPTPTGEFETLKPAQNRTE